MSSGYVSHELHLDYTLSLCVIQVCIPLVERKGDISEERRSQGLCPLTPEEAALVLRALGFGRETPIYILQLVRFMAMNLGLHNSEQHFPEL